MFPSGTTPASASWTTNSGQVPIMDVPDHSTTNNLIGMSVPVNVTNVLTVTNANISNNGRDYICAQGVVAISGAVFLTVNGE